MDDGMVGLVDGWGGWMDDGMVGLVDWWGGWMDAGMVGLMDWWDWGNWRGVLSRNAFLAFRARA